MFEIRFNETFNNDDHILINKLVLTSDMVTAISENPSDFEDWNDGADEICQLPLGDYYILKVIQPIEITEQKQLELF